MRYLLITLLAFSATARAESFTIEQALERFTLDNHDCAFEAEDIAKRRESATVQTIQDGAKEYQVFKIWCDQGAYNVNTVYYTAGTFSGLQLVQFATPVFGDKDTLQGFGTESMLTNAYFNEKTGVLDFFAKGRGLGDCFAAGQYKLVKGQFVLKKYEVDSACDGKIKPKKIVNFK